MHVRTGTTLFLAVLMFADLMPADFSARSYGLEAGSAAGRAVQPPNDTPPRPEKKRPTLKPSDTKQRPEPLKEFEPSEKIQADKEVDFPSDI